MQVQSRRRIFSRRVFTGKAPRAMEKNFPKTKISFMLRITKSVNLQFLKKINNHSVPLSLKGVEQGLVAFLGNYVYL